jgi:hypothetical protein
VVIGLAALLQAGSPAWAQEPAKTPSPKELWEAYPLDPGQAPPTATPSAELRASPSVTPSASPARAASPDDGGLSWLVVLLLAAPPVFAAGLLLGHLRSRARAAPPPAVAPSEPPAPKRFQWREYPKPARPAPPPPPVPGARAPSFEVALEDERAAATTRTKQKEPH